MFPKVNKYTKITGVDMRLVSWIWFLYVIIGFIMGGGLFYFLSYVKELGLKVKWYEWILIVLILLFFMFLMQTFIGSIQEGEPRAAFLTVVFMGLPIVIFVVLTFRSMKSRLNKMISLENTK